MAARRDARDLPGIQRILAERAGGNATFGAFHGIFGPAHGTSHGPGSFGGSVLHVRFHGGPVRHGRLGAHLHAEHHVGQLQHLAAEQRLGRAAAQIRPDATTLHGRRVAARVLDGPAPFAVDGHHGMDAGHPRREEVGREVAGAPKDAAWGRYADDLPAPHVFQKQGITCAFVRKSASASGAAHRIVGVGEAAGAQAHAISSPLSRCRCACASALRASPPHLLRRG